MFNVELEGSKNVYVNNGASQVISDVAMALINEGDEVVLLDPHFPNHSSNPKLFGGVVKSVPLIPPKSEGGEWEIDFEKF